MMCFDKLCGSNFVSSLFWTGCWLFVFFLIQPSPCNWFPIGVQYVCWLSFLQFDVLDDTCDVSMIQVWHQMLYINNLCANHLSCVWICDFLQCFPLHNLSLVEYHIWKILKTLYMCHLKFFKHCIPLSLDVWFELFDCIKPYLFLDFSFFLCPSCCHLSNLSWGCCIFAVLLLYERCDIKIVACKKLLFECYPIIFCPHLFWCPVSFFLINLFPEFCKTNDDCFFIHQNCCISCCWFIYIQDLSLLSFQEKELVFFRERKVLRIGFFCGCFGWCFFGCLFLFWCYCHRCEIVG